jgi:hypothetical protein
MKVKIKITFMLFLYIEIAKFANWLRFRNHSFYLISCFSAGNFMSLPNNGLYLPAGKS